VAARATGLILAAGAALACGSEANAPPARPASAPARIVSLVPALTETLFAIGAGHLVVGVSSFDRFPSEVQRLPRVGALIDPDTERILALRPDLILVYDSQGDAIARFAAAGIRTFEYRHRGLDHVVDTMRTLGRLTGRRAEAERQAASLLDRIDAVRTRVRDRPRVRTLLVFERQPGTLRSLYASGGAGFLNEMLDAAGATNVFADVERESVQPSHETLLARAPDVILEVRASGPQATREEEARAAWSALASVPAVRNGRVHVLTGEYLVVPGPRVAEGVEAMAKALHP
jgi:iron complex transport system substrate-binding protein